VSRDEAAELLAEIEAKRGYVLDMHRTLATADPDFLRAYEQFLGSAYLSSRSLDRREKELVYVAALTALGAPRQQLVAHFRAGLDAGATAAELLETLEQVLPPVGVPRFIDGLAAWSEACGAAAPGGDPPDDEGSE
jgi:4-carboxymuconolactone decarboxylase